MSYFAIYYKQKNYYKVILTLQRVQKFFFKSCIYIENFILKWLIKTLLIKKLKNGPTLCKNSI